MNERPQPIVVRQFMEEVLLTAIYLQSNYQVKPYDTQKISYSEQSFLVSP